MTQATNYHPFKTLTAPDGEPADIDMLMVPLIEALWAAGYETATCCQDLGESLREFPRMATYWRGYAALEMVAYPHGIPFIDVIKETPQFGPRMHWAAPGGWSMSVPVLAWTPWDGSGASVMGLIQFRFPVDQIDELAAAVREVTGQ